MHPPFPTRPSLRRALYYLYGAAALAAAASACARPVPVAGATPAEEPKAAASSGYVLVAVQNRYWSDVVVSAVRGGQTTRLGTVNAASSATLRLPGNLVAPATPLQLVARPIGGRGSYASDRFVVQPGQEINLTVESALARSSVTVR